MKRDQMKIVVEANFNAIYEAAYQEGFKDGRQHNEMKLDLIDPSILREPVSMLSLSVRGHNVLKNDNINTIGELISLTRGEILRMPNSGPHTLKIIQEELQLKGLALAG